MVAEVSTRYVAGLRPRLVATKHPRAGLAGVVSGAGGAGDSWYSRITCVIEAFMLGPSGKEGYVLPKHAPRALAAATVLALAATGSFWSLRSPAQSDLSGWRGSLGPVRAGPGRLVSVAYAPLGAPKLNAAAFRSLQRQIEARATRDPSPDALSDLAVLRLVAGAIEEGVVLLERVSRAAPRNAQVWSDLSAAYLAAEAADARQSELVARALTAADKASRLSPGLIESRFNRAVALERLALTAAGDEWRHYLRADGVSRWAEEARQRLAVLRRPNLEERWRLALPALRGAARAGKVAEIRVHVAQFALQARLWGEEELLSEAIHEALDDEPPHNRVMARRIGEALVVLSGDRFLLDAVDCIERAVARGDRAALFALDRGHQALQGGVAAYEAFEVPRAATLFRASRDDFRRVRSPFVLWADAWLAACDYREFRFDQAEARLERVERQSPAAAYPSLSGRVLWLRGLVRLSRSLHEEAVAAFRASLALYERTREAEHITSLRHLVYEYSYFTGDYEQGWRDLLPALRGVRDMANPGRQYRVVAGAALSALATGQPEAALWFQNEALLWARRSAQPVTVVLALRRRASVHQRLGHDEEALADIAEARRLALALAPGRQRTGLLGDVLLVEAELLRSGDPAAAVARYSDALSIFESTDYGLELLRTRLGRAHAYRALGLPADAEGDLATAIAGAEEQLVRLRTDDSRVAFVADLKPLFAEMASLQAEENGRPARAFAIAEMAQARALAELAFGDKSAPDRHGVTVEELQQRLPEKVVLVQFLVSDRATYAWCIGRRSFQFSRVPITRQELTERVLAFRRALAGDTRALHTLAIGLHHLLLAPFARAIPDGSTLVFVPDGPLHGVAFSALRLSASGRYLVRDHTIVIAPSTRLYLEALRRMRAGPPPRPMTALIVANPTFDREHFPHLADLPASEEEAVELARLYPRHLVLVREDATVDRLLAHAAAHDVVHLGLHGRVNLAAAGQSHLVLAPSVDRPLGALYAHELYDIGLAGPLVVVLATCDAAAGKIVQGEGPMSLVRPFLAGGVPNVLAPLWEIGDQEGRRLTTVFHRELVRGMAPAAALRTAQLDLLKSGDDELAAPRTWAAFELIGAGQTPGWSRDPQPHNAKGR